MAEVIDSALQTQSSDASAVSDTLQLLAGRVDQVITSYTSLRDSIAQIGEDHEALTSVTLFSGGKTGCFYSPHKKKSA